MAAILVLDLMSPADIRLQVLHFFPLAAIALHCKTKGEVLAGLVLSVTCQLLNYIFLGLSSFSLSIDALVFLASSVLVAFLARAAREKHFETENLATTDWLTGLHNRRSLELIFGLEIVRQKRYGGVFSLAVLDLDHFKKLNDTRGHQFGDQALALLADVLRENTREADSIARIGGDEFVVLMPNTEAAECTLLCQQLTIKIAGRMAHAGFGITASIGHATFENAPASVLEALQIADKAMYAAKEKCKDEAAKQR